MLMAVTYSISMWINNPDNNVRGANMGPIWGRQDPGGTHVGHMNFAIWGVLVGEIMHLISLLYTSTTIEDLCDRSRYLEQG